METIFDVVKGREMYSASADATVLEVTEYMVHRNIGAVPLLNKDGELVGIFSERDLMKRVVAGHRNPGSTKVSEVMTPRPRTVDVNETWENCLFLMREHGFRHLPVCEGKKIVGLISIRDLLDRQSAERDAENKMMRSYIAGQ
jgi:CBS domain-containing protein